MLDIFAMDVTPLFLSLPIVLLLIAFFCGSRSLTGILHPLVHLGDGREIVLVCNFPLSRSFLCFRQRRIPFSLKAVRQRFMNYSRNGRIIHEDECTKGSRHLIVGNRKAKQIHNLRVPVILVAVRLHSDCNKVTRFNFRIN